VVVAGDFNCAGSLIPLRGNAAHVAQLDDLLQCASAVPATVGGPTFRAGLLSWLLDRIYVRGLDLKRQGRGTNCRGSDHLPVWCTLRLAETGSNTGNTVESGSWP
jgi:endonuclease/exonuclease/phosphatase family metal-dependent hydrolase